MPNNLQKAVVLFPIWLILLSDVLVNFSNSISIQFKLVATVYMIAFAFQKGIHVSLFFSLLLTLLFLAVHLVISFSLLAGINELVRYIFPFAFLLYGYSLRKHYFILRNTILSFLLLANGFQIITYFLIFLNIEPVVPLIPMEMADKGVRATGFMSHFAPFGFGNLVGFIICYFDREIRYRKFLLMIFVAFIVLSTSYKSIFTLLFFVFLFSNRKILITSGLTLIAITFVISFPQESIYLSDVIAKKLEFYVIEGNSARAESYRVMVEKLASLTFWLGEGIGSFGGPASIDYNSPTYDKFNFNWYSYGELGTTDTYYPHLFVELGLIGAVVYLFTLALPAFKLGNLENHAKKMIIAIYLALFADSIMSFSLNAPIFLVLSLTLIYPIKYNLTFQSYAKRISSI